MPKRSKTPGTLVIGLKLVLRLVALLCFVIGGLAFFFSNLTFATVGIIVAIGTSCLIYAEFTEE